MTILYCAETPQLKLGPGREGSDFCIVFRDGYAEVDPTDPMYDEKMSWVNYPGNPLIRVLGEEEVPSTDPDAVPCPECGKPFASNQKLNGHLMHHRKKA